MKKFLSVLLALAVAFTFTFGSAMSAFAATAVDENPVDAYTTNQTTLTKEYNDCVAKLASKYTETVGNATVTVDKTVYETIAKEIYNTYMSVLEAQNAAGAGFETDLGEAYGDLAGLSYSDVDTQAKFNALVLSTGTDKPYFNKTMELAFDGYKEAVKAELNKLNLSLYSDKEMTDAHYNAAASVSTGNLYKVTYKQFVTDLRDEAIKKINTTYIAQLTAANEDTRITTAYNTVQAKLALLDNSATNTESVSYTLSDGTRIFVSYEVAANKNVPTIKDLDASAITDEATVAAKKAAVDSKVAAYIADNSSTTDAATAAKKLAASYKEVMYSRIENAADPSAVSIPEVSATETDDNLTYNDIKDKYTALETYAATAKVMVDATGALIYDSAIIDKNLAEAKIEVYDGDSNFSSRDAITANAKISEQSLDWAKETKIAAYKEALKEALYEANGDAKYYALEQAQIEAKYQEVIDKITAATTQAQLEAITGTVSTTGILDKEDTVAAIKALTQFAKEKTKLDKYVDLLNGDTKSWESGYKAPMTADQLADFYATNNARTNAEITALYDAAKAECDKIPTKGEIADAKKAAEDVVKALPDYITLANKDAVEAAFKAAAELEENYGVTISNEAKLNNAIAQLKSAVVASLDEAVKALPATITAADKDAVNALLANIEAYETNDAFATENGYESYAKKNTVLEAARKVREAELKNVIDAIAALPENATADQVNAVKAKYDAFVEEYTDTVGEGINTAPYKADSKVTNYEKLAYLLASIAEADVWGTTEVKASLFDSSRKLTIWKTTKTSIRVTSVGSVGDIKDHGYTVKYKFYKKAPGSSTYKLVKTTTSNKYTYTNLKKGTNKFQVKVCVYDADGKLVASKWTYYRAAKIK